jgi:hypothetical protein
MIPSSRIASHCCARCAAVQGRCAHGDERAAKIHRRGSQLWRSDSVPFTRLDAKLLPLPLLNLCRLTPVLGKCAHGDEHSQAIITEALSFGAPSRLDAVMRDVFAKLQIAQVTPHDHSNHISGRSASDQVDRAAVAIAKDSHPEGEQVTPFYPAPASKPLCLTEGKCAHCDEHIAEAPSFGDPALSRSPSRAIR